MGRESTPSLLGMLSARLCPDRTGRHAWPWIARQWHTQTVVGTSTPGAGRCSLVVPSPISPGGNQGIIGGGKSFPSGHAAMGYVLVLGTCLVSPRRSPWLRGLVLGGALAYGSLLGATRVIQGGHFLSDVLWSGSLMCFTVATLQAVLLHSPARHRHARICASRGQPIQWTNLPERSCAIFRLSEGDIMSRIPHASPPLARLTRRQFVRALGLSAVVSYRRRATPRLGCRSSQNRHPPRSHWRAGGVRQANSKRCHPGCRAAQCRWRTARTASSSWCTGIPRLIPRLALTRRKSWWSWIKSWPWWALCQAA